MPNSSGAATLLRLLQSLAGSGNSTADIGDYLAAGQHLQALLLGLVSGDIFSSVTQAGASSLGGTTAAGFTGQTNSVLSSLLAVDRRNPGRVLSYLPSGLIGGLLGSLIGSGGGDIPTSRTPFTLPPSITLEAGLRTSSPPTVVDYSQDGMPRTMSATGYTLPSSVVVNVQAMDSRSFLDHSDDIARAVREALLNSHPLGSYLAE
jgi:hypothetical protein